MSTSLTRMIGSSMVLTVMIIPVQKVLFNCIILSTKGNLGVRRMSEQILTCLLSEIRMV